MQTTEKIYKTTEKECADKVKGLVCDGCGGGLKPLETVDNSGDPTFWPTCEVCQKYCWGVDVKTFLICKRMFENGMLAYGKMHEPTNEHDAAYYKSCQISGLRNILSDVRKSIKEVESDKQKLIDAAPELLGALKKAQRLLIATMTEVQRKEIQNYLSGNFQDQVEHSVLHDSLGIESAIKKATE